MKKAKLFIAALLLTTASLMTEAQDAKMHLRDFSPKYTVTSFRVYGQCGLCTRRILKALNEKGVKSAYWDKDSQLLTLQYDAKAIKVESIYSALAAAGHDTEKVKAKAEVYNALPGCCRYRNVLNIH